MLVDVEERRLPGALIVADERLVQACRMWCETKGLKPIPIGTPTEFDGMAMRQAVADFKGGFADLNERQRRLIASCL